MSRSSAIFGDENVHLDIPSNHLVLKSYSLLNRQSFYQAVTVPTHRLGHALDNIMLSYYILLHYVYYYIYIIICYYYILFYIIRPTDDLVCSTTVTQLLSSDHYCVVCDFSTIKPGNHAELKQSRNLRVMNLTTLKVNICQIISPTLCLF